MSNEKQTIAGAAVRSDLSYKYQRLRERLREAVLKRELPPKLPGERELGRQYGANAKTINKALNDLAMEGLLIRRVGRGTFIAGHAPNDGPIAAPARYAWVAASGSASGEAQFERSRELLQHRGHRLERVTCSPDAAGEIPEAALPLSLLRQVRGLVIAGGYPSRELLGHCRRRHLSVVLVHNHHDEIRLSAVAGDLAYGAFALTEHLIQLGHTHIRIVLRADWLPLAEVAAAGYRAAMLRYGLAARETIVRDGSQMELDLAHADRPTAVVCLSAGLAAEVVARGRAAALRVPQDLSVAVVAEPGDGSSAEQGHTAFEFDTERIVHWAVELLLSASAGQEPALVMVPGRLALRSSTAPPAATGTRCATPTETRI